MKIPNLFFLSCLISLVLLSSTSCKDDIEVNLPDIEENMKDLTDGLNVKIIEVDRETSFHIPLGTKKEVKWEILNESNQPANFDFRLQSDENDLKTLVCEKIDDEYLKSNRPHLFTLKLSVAKGTATKNVKVVVRSSGTPSKALYAQNYLGHGMNPSDKYQSVKSSVLDFNSIQDIISVTEYESPKIIKFETGGRRYAETMHILAEKTGLMGDALYPGVLSNGKFTNEDVQCDDVINFEYYLGYRGMIESEISVNKEDLDKALQEGLITKYLDVTTNDLFNNSNSEEYKKYSNDYQGISELLDRTGAFIITSGGFGGTYTYKFARKENVYYDNIANDASRFLRDNLTNVSAYMADYQKYISGSGDSHYVNTDHFDTSYLNGDEYKKIPYFYTDFDCTGAANSKAMGRFSRDELKDTIHDIRHWEGHVKEASTNWVLTTYNACDEKGNYKENRLIPVYEFISEPARKEAVKANFKEYLNNSIKQREEHHLVVADFYMGAFKERFSGDLDHKKYPPQLKIIQSPTTGALLPGVVLGGNLNSPTRVNKSFETNCDDFIVCVTEAYHYWYYALGYREDGEGFTDIRFDNSNLKGGWVRRGDHADIGTRTVLLDDNYVWIKPATTNTALKDIVKAVALSKNKDNSHYYGDLIMASTVPANMPATKPSDTNQFRATPFFKYWDTNSAHPYDDTHFYEGGAVFYNRFKIVANWNEYPNEHYSLSWGEDVVGEPKSEAIRPYNIPSPLE